MVNIYINVDNGPTIYINYIDINIILNSLEEVICEAKDSIINGLYLSHIYTICIKITQLKLLVLIRKYIGGTYQALHLKRSTCTVDTLGIET